MTRLGSPPRARGRSQTAQRLNQFLAAHSDDWHEFTLVELGGQFGITSQAIHRLLPDWGRYRASARAEWLRNFAADHPGARRPKNPGTMTWSAIGRELGVSGECVAQLWRKLGLPSDVRSTDEQLKERHALRQQVRNARVLRDEICEVCARRFSWTGFRERERRNKGKRFVCSRSCAQRARSHPLTDRR